MKLSSRIRSISYLKAHASDVVKDLNRESGPMIITQNGEAKLVVQDVQSYEETQETMALLKILALGSSQIEAHEVTAAGSAMRELRRRRKARE